MQYMFPEGLAGYWLVWWQKQHVKGQAAEGISTISADSFPDTGTYSPSQVLHFFISIFKFT